MFLINIRSLIQQKLNRLVKHVDVDSGLRRNDNYNFCFFSVSAIKNANSNACDELSRGSQCVW